MSHYLTLTVSHTEIGEAMSDEELLEMIRTADKNQDQKVHNHLSASLCLCLFSDSLSAYAIANIRNAVLC